MRRDQTILGHVIKHALIAIYVVVEDEIQVVTWPFCRAKYARKASVYFEV